MAIEYSDLKTHHGPIIQQPPRAVERKAQSYVPEVRQNMVPAALRKTFIQADRLRGKWPKLGTFIDDSEADMLAHMDFPASHRAKLHSTRPVEPLNKEVKRRANVVGMFTNEPRNHPANRGGAAGDQRRVTASAPLHAD